MRNTVLALCLLLVAASAHTLAGCGGKPALAQSESEHPTKRRDPAFEMTPICQNDEDGVLDCTAQLLVDGQPLAEMSFQLLYYKDEKRLLDGPTCKPVEATAP